MFITHRPGPFKFIFMLRTTRILFSLLVIGAMISSLSSCKKDDDPVYPKLSFDASAMNVSENQGIVEVEIELDRPAPVDILVEYDVSGTAQEGDDFDLLGTPGEVEIEKGETKGIIRLEIISDNLYEEDETIILRITDVDNNKVIITDKDRIEITIKNDDAPATVSFKQTTMTVNEAIGFETALLEVEVQLDKPAGSDLIVEYEIDGTAIDTVYGASQNIPSQFWDYHINGTSGEILIPKGKTTGKIEVKIYVDFRYELDETIIFRLTGGNGVQVGDNDEITITLKEQDGKIIALFWEGTGVDMDLFMWIGENHDQYFGLVSSNFAGTNPPEAVFIPDGITDGAFGLSLVYYSGNVEPLEIEVRFRDFKNGQMEPQADWDVYTATYTLANRNPYDQTGNEPQVVQTFKKVNGEFVDISDIQVPSSGSRQRQPKLPALPQKLKILNADQFIRKP